VRVRGDSLIFDYDAKSGQHRLCEVVDPDVREVVAALRRRRAPAAEELLAYRDPERGWVDVKSSDINDYVRELLGDGFSAKDFRTWVGTVLAAAGLAAQDPVDSEVARRRTVAAVVKDVAEHLGNTPAVARSAYIDPRVVDGFEVDDTVAQVLADLDEADLAQGVPEELEQAVLRLIDRARRRSRRGRNRGS
jgi:DNA topoisomerase IB